jgi:hypothetical protein
LSSLIPLGAFGEICKDVILHPVDTLKNRLQAKKKQAANNSGGNDPRNSGDGKPQNSQIAVSSSNVSPGTTAVSALSSVSFSSNVEYLPDLRNKFRFSLPDVAGLYAGLPAVMLSSIPQGGTFFLVKKGLIEGFHVYAPFVPEFIGSIVSIGFGCMAYWVFRTPIEVIKTQVQTGMFQAGWVFIIEISMEN